MDTVTINRAPVLSLWAAVVAERLGFDRDEALTLGKSVAGLTAQSKGQRLGIFTPSPEALAAEGFRLYEAFRPGVPSGESGWGAKGTLSLAKIALPRATS
jgi:hypothetical protein